MPAAHVDDESPSTDINLRDGPGHQEKPGALGALLNNPLAGMSREEILADVDLFVEEKGLAEHRDVFRKGGLIAQVNHTDFAFEQIQELSEDEKAVLRKEITHRWSQPFMMYFLCTLCAGSAIVQGMDQSAVNASQTFYFDELNITRTEIQGLVNGAPYLCSALLGCWSNPILNHYFGRRGTIFISCFMSVVTGFWMAAADSWYNLLVARFFLGFAVGAKSSTTPVYSAESTPKTIRGALTMMWQMWTAFGIALGTIMGVAFSQVTIFGENTQWRWIMASTSIPPLIVMVQVYLCPESPRWYMEKGKYNNAFHSISRLRWLPIQAARDMYYAHKLLQIEATEREGRSWTEFFTVRRNRRAAQSSWFVMFMQQFCGVNVIVYYSKLSVTMFMDAGYTRDNALLFTMGTGLVNWLFAIPAIYTIDTFGRRNLLLVTYPLMAIFMFFTGFSFLIPNNADGSISEARLACVATGLFIFMACYSPGSGPVPFTYSAEAFPLHIRDIGMCSATAVTWGFNFIISFSWLPMNEAFGNVGAFCWYGAWNLIGWVLCYFFLPETKNLTLEELDVIFSVTNREHATYYLKKLPWYIKKYFLFMDVPPMPPLYQLDDRPSSTPHATNGLTDKTEPQAQHDEERKISKSE